MGININIKEILDATNSNINTLIKSIEEITGLLNEIEYIVEEDDIVGIEKIIVEEIESMNEFMENEYYEVIHDIQKTVNETTKSFEELDNETERSL